MNETSGEDRTVLFLMKQNGLLEQEPEIKRTKARYGTDQIYLII